MGLIIAIILGAFIGWAASKLTGRDHGILMYLVIGVVGSFVGSFVSRMVTGTNESYLAFSWTGLFWSFIGAVILLVILNALTGRRRHVA